MITPTRLKKGDRIGLVAPSSPTSLDKVNRSIEFIRKLGFEPVVGESCYSKEDYLSGGDSIRAKDLNSMFMDKSIDGIWCIRGGYGTPRILDMIDYEIINENPKVFIGYSDITALHISFNQICSLITYHGPMVSTELINNIDIFTLNGIMNSITEELKGNIENPDGVKIDFHNELYCEGNLIGGNLSLIASTLGTRFEIDTKGKILFLEDVDEEPYRIDRMMAQLRLSGKLDDAIGFLVGDWNNCISEDINLRNTDYLVQEYLSLYDKPLVTNLQAGHCKPMVTLAMGNKLIIDGKKNLLRWA